MVTLSTTRINTHKFYVLPTKCINTVCFVRIYRTNSGFYLLRHSLIGFYDLDVECLLRGRKWVFKYTVIPRLTSDPAKEFFG